MITKTEHQYICSLGSGMAKTVILMDFHGQLTLWEGSDGRPFKTVGEAEKYLCDNYHEVMLDTKTDFIITKLERVVQ
jgi:hypothetical protein